MKPYYQHAGITIYHGDCREIVPALGQFDLLLTDPPYGMDYQSAWRTEWQRKPKIQGDTEFPKFVFEITPSIASFIFCRWDNLPEIPTPKSFIVWDKCRHSMGDLEHEFGRQWEAIAFYPGPSHAFIRRPVDVIRVPCVPPSSLVHPNEKPSALIHALLSCHGGKTVLDPFMGSGSTLIAAKETGRSGVGVELEERYCEIAANRLAQEILIPC